MRVKDAGVHAGITVGTETVGGRTRAIFTEGQKGKLPRAQSLLGGPKQQCTRLPCTPCTVNPSTLHSLHTSHPSALNSTHSIPFSPALKSVMKRVGRSGALKSLRATSRCLQARVFVLQHAGHNHTFYAVLLMRRLYFFYIY